MPSTCHGRAYNCLHLHVIVHWQEGIPRYHLHHGIEDHNLHFLHHNPMLTFHVVYHHSQCWYPALLSRPQSSPTSTASTATSSPRPAKRRTASSAPPFQTDRSTAFPRRRTTAVARSRLPASERRAGAISRHFSGQVHSSINSQLHQLIRGRRDGDQHRQDRPEQRERLCKAAA